MLFINLKCQTGTRRHFKFVSMHALLFHFFNLIALTGWVFLIGFPSWSHTARGVLNGIIIALCAFYAILVIHWYQTGGIGGFDSLASVMLLFKSEKAVLAGWIHYLAFDLFVGLWLTTDAQRIGLPRWALIPVQLLTFMLGPIGFAVYMVVRRRRTGEFLKGL